MFINRISHSKEACYKECPGKYKLRYIDKVPEDPESDKGAMQFGSFIHEVFEYGVSASTMDELYSLGKQFKDKYEFSKSYDKLIKPCYENFLRLNAQLTETIAAEQKIVLETTDGYEIIAIIDRVVKGKNDEILILDYKTGRNEKTKHDLFSDRQLQKYTLAVHKHYDIPINKIAAGHFYPRTNNLVVLKYLPHQILAEQRKTTQTIWEIRKNKKTDFPFTKNRYCNWCSYRIYCPLFNDPNTIQHRLDEAIKKKPDQK